MIRTNQFIGCLQTALMALCCLVVFNACSDDSSDSARQEQERQAQELKAKLAGTWNMDTDGLSDINLTMTEYHFTDNQMVMSYYVYDFENDGYDKEVLPFDYTVLNSTQDDYREVHQVRITPAQKTLEWLDQKNKELIEEAEKLGQKDFKPYDAEDLTDTLQFVLRADSLGLLIPEENILYYASEGFQLEDDAIYFQRGAIDFTTIDTKTVRASIDEMRKEVEEYQALIDDDESMLNVPKLMAKTRRAPETQHIYDNKGHELRQWMKFIPDDRMLCKMMIPGAHDAGTYGMYWDWMLTVAKTQEQDIRGQWDHGIRCFDLRVRYWDDENRLYHSMISCDKTMKDVFAEVQEKLRENPQDGAILMIKTEGNDAEALGEIVSRLVNVVPFGVTGGEPDNIATTEETVKLVEEYFLNQTVDGHPMLAKFHPDMTMKDLRGRVVVLLQNAPSESDVDYGKLKEYLGVDLGNKYANMLGASRPLKVQNDWEQDSGQAPFAYLQRKTSAFRQLLFESVEDADGTYWVYNAANGYYRDVFAFGDIIPDYATYAEQAYPIFTRDVIRYGNPRGIVLLDYVGFDHFKRVKMATLAGWGAGTVATGLLFSAALISASGFGLGVAAAISTTYLGVVVGGGIFQSLLKASWATPHFCLFWLVYKALKADADYKDPKSQDLVNAIVEVNFPEQHDTGVSDDPVDVGR